jgi:hypothetical protein
MRTFLQEFETRRGEVLRYLAVMVLAERAISAAGGAKYDDELKIFRAGALLVIYNAVEASARLGILAIYDEIEQTETTFDELKERFRVKILQDFKSNVGSKSFPSLRRIAVDLVIKSLDEQKLFSGNVDAKKLRDVGQDYGFDTTTEHRLTKHGADLLTVKSRRQDLAHGNESFSEVGKQYTTDDVRRIARYSLAYMGAILRNIDLYLDNRGYKEPPKDLSSAAAPPPVKRGLLWRCLSLLLAWEERRSR